MRRWVQFALLALFVYLLAITKWPPSDTVLVDAFLTIDPLLSLQAVLASRTWVDSAAYGLVLLGLTLFFGRFFCGWMCPFGTCLEACDDLLYKKKKRVWKNSERHLRWLKYGLLLIIVVAAIFKQSAAYLADPISWATRIIAYALWPMFVAIERSVLIALRPLFESLGWMNLARADISQPVFSGLGILSLAFFVVLVWLGGKYQRRFWCRTLCPLGALFGLVSRFSLFHRHVGHECDDDGRCSKVCQTGAIGSQYREYDPGECIQCGLCVSKCHLKVTSFVPAIQGEGRAPSFDFSRRKALGFLGTGAVGSAWLALNPKRTLVGDDGLRPPGALIEKHFLAKCVRCGQCIKACPTNCLQPAAFETGVAGLMTPITNMRIGPCDQNCNMCGHVCPTDAIRDLDFDEKPYAKIGNAVIEPGRCVVWEQNLHCLVCDENCPYGAIYWKEVDGARRPFVDENRCNGCGQCEAACPVEGVSAIRIYPSGQIRLNEGSYRKKARDLGLILEEDKLPY